MLIAITTRFEKRQINTGFQTFFRDVMYFQSLTLVHGEPFPDPLPLSRCFLQI